jgi:hypothetical protein
MEKINLQTLLKPKEYRSLLHKKLINLTPKQEIDDEWEQIKTTIVDAARDKHKVNLQGMNGGMNNTRKSFKTKTKQGKYGCKRRQE